MDTVSKSQVVELLNFYARDNDFEEIVLLIGKETKNGGYLEDLDKRVRIDFFFFYPCYFLVSLLTVFSLRKKLKSLPDSAILHVRTEYMSGLVLRALRGLNRSTKKILVDVRGAFVEELEQSKRFGFARRINKLIDYYLMVRPVFKSLNYFNTVTSDLSDYIVLKHGLHSKNLFCVPTIVSDRFKYSNQERIKVRNELGLTENDIVGIFVTGSSQGWQCEEQVLELLSNQSIKLIMLSKEKILNERVISRFVKHSEVCSYLSASDFAVILRDNHLINAVASPIKFSEYMVCGLPVIHNGTVNIINKLTAENGYGCLCKDFKFDSINRLKKIDRNEISSFGKNVFGVDKCGGEYIEVYKRMIVDSGC